MLRTSLIILLVVGLAGAANVLWRAHAGVRTGIVSDIDEFWRLKASAAPDFDLVIVGDSRAYRGIDPASMRESLPHDRILNFGFAGAGLTADFVEAAAAKIDPRSDRPALLVAITPNSLTRLAAENRHWHEVAQRADAGAGPLAAFASSARSWFRPLVRDPTPILQDLAARRVGERFTELYYENGWVDSLHEASGSDRTLEQYRSVFSKQDGVEAGVGELATEVERLVRRGIAIYVARPPTTSAMEELEATVAGFDERAVRRRLAAVGAQWLGVETDDCLSYDGSHLDALSARRYSHRLGEAIAGVRASPVR